MLNAMFLGGKTRFGSFEQQNRYVMDVVWGVSCQMVTRMQDLGASPCRLLFPRRGIHDGFLCKLTESRIMPRVHRTAPRILFQRVHRTSDLLFQRPKKWQSSKVKNTSEHLGVTRKFICT